MANSRTRNCAQCGESFTYAIGRGQDRRFCSDFCRTKRRHALAKTKPLCSGPNCKNLRISAVSGLCSSCYCRVRRTGTVDRREFTYRSLGTNGYVRVSKADHPLSSTGGFVYEHRMVLYDAIGDGPHPCHWCGTEVRWIKGVCRKSALVADHLDGNKQNNSRENLVPACNPCNAARGMFMGWVRRHQDDPVLWAMYTASRAQRGA